MQGSWQGDIAFLPLLLFLPQRHVIQGFQTSSPFHTCAPPCFQRAAGRGGAGGLFEGNDVHHRANTFTERGQWAGSYGDDEAEPFVIAVCFVLLFFCFFLRWHASENDQIRDWKSEAKGWTYVLVPPRSWAEVDWTCFVQSFVLTGFIFLSLWTVSKLIIKYKPTVQFVRQRNVQTRCRNTLFFYFLHFYSCFCKLQSRAVATRSLQKGQNWSLALGPCVVLVVVSGFDVSDLPVVLPPGWTMRCEQSSFRLDFRGDEHIARRCWTQVPSGLDWSAAEGWDDWRLNVGLLDAAGETPPGRQL